MGRLKGIKNPKPQDRRKHSEDQDLNQEHLEGQNIGDRRFDEMSSRTAADLKEFADTLSSFRGDELEQIPIVPPGARLKQGAVYLDVRNPTAGAVAATEEMKATPENLYIPKAEVPYEYWDRLLAIFSEQEPSGNVKGRSKISDEMVDQTLADSFPASDPPSWNMGREAKPSEFNRQAKQRAH
jgi:hypothetical protein